MFISNFEGFSFTADSRSASGMVFLVMSGFRLWFWRKISFLMREFSESFLVRYLFEA